MDKFPPRPFLTKDFSVDGGGIDYLGLRLVNLKLLTEELLPEINNVTTDMGTFFLGTWIPWKFKKLCEVNNEFFTEDNYRAFKEAVEVIVGYVIRDNSPSDSKFGRVRTRIGVEQKYPAGKTLSFEHANRNDNNTMYSAPLYGPSLSYLNLVDGYAVSQSNTATSIHLAVEDEHTSVITGAVESALKESSHSKLLTSFQFDDVDPKVADDLGLKGLSPAYYRTVSLEAKDAFAAKLLSAENNRTLSARLVVETLRQMGAVDATTLRGIWHTGMSPDGSVVLILNDQVLIRHRNTWAAFQSRQIQRYFMEAFLCCFEKSVVALDGGDFEGNIEWLVRSGSEQIQDKKDFNFLDIVHGQLIEALGDIPDTWDAAATAWGETVYLEHNNYDYVEYSGKDGDFLAAMVSMARWWIRLGSAVNDAQMKEIYSTGGSSRVSASVLYAWLKDRLHMPLESFSREFISGMVFSQHLRIALSRLDGRSQRLRFTLGDRGIVPTAKVTNFGASTPPWMADRLEAFLCLLEDLEIVVKSKDNTYSLGCNADRYWA